MSAAAAAVAAIGGGVIGTVGHITEGNSAKNIAHLNAEQAELDAKFAEVSAKEEARTIRRTGMQFAGKQKAGYAKAGVALSGSPLDVMADSAREIELDALKVEYKGNVQGEAYRREAHILRKQGNTAQQMSRFKAVSSLLQAGASASGAMAAGG